MTGKTKVLMLSPAPSDLVYLRLDEEVLEIEHKLGGCPFGDLLEFIPRSGIQVHDLGILLLRHRPHILHFSGHSSPSEGIILVDADGYRRPIGVQWLTNILRTLTGNIHLIILNVCDTKSYAEAISQEIDFVIGMDGSIEEAAAIIFASYFYQALASGRSVKEAFEIAKILVASSAPILLIRQGVKDSDPFLSKVENKTHGERLRSAQGHLITEMEIEPLQEAISRDRDIDQGEEVWRWQTEDGRFVVYAKLEPNADLILHFSVRDSDMEGARFKIKVGELNREVTLQRVSESESQAEVVIPRRQRPRNLADISIEVIQRIL